MKYFLWFLLTSFLINTSLAEEKKDPRTPVVIIDTGVKFDKSITPYLCTKGHRDFTVTSLNDTVGHGNNITHIIARGMNKEKYCLMIYKWTTGYKVRSSLNIESALMFAIMENPYIINMSLSGADGSLRERNLIEQALHLGIIINVAAGNNDQDLKKDCTAFPACYNIESKSFHVVANFHKEKPVCGSNFGGPVTNIENGWFIHAGGHTLCGTSQATAILTGKMVR